MLWIYQNLYHFSSTALVNSGQLGSLLGLNTKETSGRLSHEFSHLSIFTHTAFDQGFLEGELLLILSSKYNINSTYNKLGPWTCTKSGASNHPGLGLFVWLLFVPQGPLACWLLVPVWLLFSYFLAMGIFLFALKIKKAQKKWKESGGHSRYNFDCSRLKYWSWRFPGETTPHWKFATHLLSTDLKPLRRCLWISML